DPTCPCLACRHGKGYLRHLFLCQEMLGPILLTHHNLTFYQRLMAEARSRIAAGGFGDWLAEQRRLLGGGEGGGGDGESTGPPPTHSPRRRPPKRGDAAESMDITEQK